MLCQLFVGTSFPRLFHQDLQIILLPTAKQNNTPKMFITTVDGRNPKQPPGM